MSKYLIKENELPKWFKYPSSFLKVIDQNLVDISPWHILSNDLLEIKYNGLKERYPNLSLVPFARRFDNDDVACWEKSQLGKVIIIHDYASEGWEIRQIYDDFWSWFKVAIDDMIKFE
ncbi:hypothetical protein ACO2Q8_20460 [Larkinella sp. VNQ87]|uniref:hypothetical protein n=1 Tax=Larkinella sp. VNQ87 TaxID=3400921 RepID=UPI003C08CA40